MTQTVKNSDLSKVNFNLQFSFLYFKGGFNLGQVFVKFIWKEGFFSFRINTYFASIWKNILIHQVLYVEWFPFSLKLSAFKKNVCWMVGRGYFNWILIDLCIQHGNSQQILSFCPFCSNVLSWDRVLKKFVSLQFTTQPLGCSLCENNNDNGKWSFITNKALFDKKLNEKPSIY